MRIWPWLLMGLAGCGAVAPARRLPEGTSSLHYEVKLDGDLSLLEVELCFRGGISGGLIPGRSEAGYRLRYARWLSPGPIERLPSRDGRISVPEGRREGCLGYGVSLRDGGSLSAIVRREGAAMLASPNAWLWRPYRRAKTLQAELVLTLPSGAKASLPWPAQNGVHQLGASAFAFDSHAAFGDLRMVHTTVGDVPASVAVLGALPLVDNAGLAHWLEGAVHTANQSDGTFPGSALQLIVLGEPGGYEPFGSVARGGSASVLMFVPRQYGASALRSDWVLPHELSHMLLPFVERDDAWLPEGLATYYQELLRARAGVQTPEQALENLRGAMASAAREGTGRTLCEESRSMHQTGAYRAVYWGGAATWLLADVALRKRGGRTLDQLLSTVRREARMTPPYRADELIAWLDRLSETRVFSELAAECAARPFPDYTPALEALGVGVERPSEGQRALGAALFAAQGAK